MYHILAQAQAGRVDQGERGFWRVWALTEDRVDKKVDGRGQRGDRSALALLEAAREAFAARGYAGASVRDIAGAAGVNPGLVRYHFGSKEGLYAQVMDEAMGRLEARLLEASGGPGGTRARVHRVVEAYVAHLVEDRLLPRLIQRALLDNDGVAIEAVQGRHRALKGGLSPLVGAFEQLQGPLGPLDEVVITIFSAAIAPFLYEPLISGVLGRDVLSEAALQRRRAHLLAMVDVALADLLPREVTGP